MTPQECRSHANYVREEHSADSALADAFENAAQTIEVLQNARLRFAVESAINSACIWRMTQNPVSYHTECRSIEFLFPRACESFKYCPYCSKPIVWRSGHTANDVIDRLKYTIKNMEQEFGGNQQGK